MRYGLVEPSGLDRTATARWVSEVVDWSRARIHRAQGPHP
jgi:hypothetical protein